MSSVHESSRQIFNQVLVTNFANVNTGLTHWPVSQLRLWNRCRLRPNPQASSRSSVALKLDEEGLVIHGPTISALCYYCMIFVVPPFGSFLHFDSAIYGTMYNVSTTLSPTEKNDRPKPMRISNDGSLCQLHDPPQRTPFSVYINI